MAGSSLLLSELLEQIGQVLGKGFPSACWVVAEILELHINRSGHCYLELIEKHPDTESIRARVRATIWANKFSMLRPYFEASTGTTLKSGIKVLCKASVEFHAQFGLSLNITDIDPSFTLGDLARQKQEVIHKLTEQGVMDMNRELPFPVVPQRIAVISSESAAGYGDFIQTLIHNRYGFQFIATLFPAVMQGSEAPGSIGQAMDRIFESIKEFDCMAIIRGGGARADLECYNHYDLAYYITQFPLPVLTGIGHERDESVADMVAARKLKTPTAVAEYLVDRLLEFEFRLNANNEKLYLLVKQVARNRMRDLDRYVLKLEHVTGALFRGEKERMSRAHLNLARVAGSMLKQAAERLENLDTRRALVDPVNVLKRGYSITSMNGTLLRSSSGITAGDVLETRLEKGSIISIADKINKPDGKGKDQLR